MAEKTDYQKVTEKLREVGADWLGSMTTEDDNGNVYLDRWMIGEAYLIVVADQFGECGLYQFVGIHRDPVENDLEFIEKLARKNVE
jgi:hypothetical protein